MKYLAYLEKGKRRYGLLEGDRVKVLDGGLFDDPKPTGETQALSDLRLLAPVEPSKAVCVGLNYHDHIARVQSHNLRNEGYQLIHTENHLVGVRGLLDRAVKPGNELEVVA